MKKASLLAILLALTLVFALSLTACDSDDDTTDTTDTTESTDDTTDDATDDTLIDEDATQVTSSDELLEALANGDELIVVTESFELELSEALVIDYTTSISGIDDVVITVTRSEDFAIATTSDEYTLSDNENIVITGSGVVLDNLTFDFSNVGADDTAFYGISVGYGSGQWTAPTVDSFTITNCTIIFDGSYLCALYVGNSPFVGTLTIDSCIFDGGSVGMYTTDIDAISVIVTNNTFSNSVDNELLYNYFWLASYGGTVSEEATVTFSGNTLSGKYDMGDSWLGTGVENGSSVAFDCSDNSMTVTSDELEAISSDTLDSKYITEGITLVEIDGDTEADA